MTTLHLKDENDDIRQAIRQHEMLISGSDIAFGGAAIARYYEGVVGFSASILALSHIVSRIVLSDRLVITGNLDGLNKPPSLSLWSLLDAHCDLLLMEQFHPAIHPIIQDTALNPVEVFGETLVSDVVEAENAYAPTKSVSITPALLAEYAVSNLLEVPYAPNPVLSRPIAKYALIGKASSEQLVRFLDDLRREEAEDMNLYEELQIYDLEVPAIFSAVLRNSKDPEDIIRVAAQMNREAKAFRAWCRALEITKDRNIKKYREQLKAAQSTLRKLGSTLGAEQTERAQISTGSYGPTLPAPTLRKVIDYLDVDVKFLRPRHFLLNVLSSSLQLKQLSPELARVFGVPEDMAKEAAERMIQLAAR